MRAAARALRRSCAVSCALAIAVACASGCDDDDDDDEQPLHTRCDLTHDGSELQGEWTLIAHGKRRRCEDRTYEGDVVIETETPIDVVSEAQATSGLGTAPTPDAIADAFVQRIERAEFVLGLSSGAPDELRVSGGTVGSCMSATLSEDLRDDLVVFELDGAITEPGYAEGDFTGEGPAGCRVEGTFELLIR
jgi:hypothetical protein